MNIALILLGRYPTDKAYGITTQATIENLVNMGHKVKILSFPFPNQEPVEFEPYEKLEFSENYFLKFCRRKFSENNRFINKFFWRLYVASYLSWVRNICLNLNFDLLWMRNFEVYEKLLKIESKKIFELHSIPSEKQKESFRMRKQKLLLAPISRQIQLSVQDLKVPMIFSPMGIKRSYISLETDIINYVDELPHKNKFELVYVGKLYPGGVSKGVETLIAIADQARLKKENITIKVVGGDKKETERFNNLIYKNELVGYFQILGQLTHESAIQEIKKSDAIVLTRSADVKYNGFPIKAIEALASGKLILVEKSKVYDDIFNNQTFVLWFDRKNIDKMFVDLKKSLESPNLVKKLNENIIEAQKHTWEQRTLNLVSYGFENYPTESQ